MTGNQANLEDIQSTLARLYVLVETSHFEVESERAAMLQRLNDLNQEVLGHENLPDSLHQALCQVEGFAMNRLEKKGGGNSINDTSSLTWRDVGPSFIESWKAKHPKFAAAFMEFNNQLSKLGI